MKNNRLLPFVFLLLLCSASCAYGMVSKRIAFKDSSKITIILKADVLSPLFFLAAQNSLQYFEYNDKIRALSFTGEIGLNETNSIQLTSIRLTEYYANEYYAYFNFMGISDKQYIREKALLSTWNIMPEYKHFLESDKQLKGFYVGVNLKYKIDHLTYTTEYPIVTRKIDYKDYSYGVGAIIGYQTYIIKDKIVLDFLIGGGIQRFNNRRVKHDDWNDNLTREKKVKGDLRAAINIGYKF